MRNHLFLALAVLSMLVVAGCGNSDGPAAGGGERLVQKAATALPPGQSGFVSAAGQAAGMVSGDYGEHIDDQRSLYWSFEAKPAALGSRPGTPEAPKEGVQVYRDAFGVPIVYADTVRDLWFGVGYAVAQDRLFLMDAVRRTGAGTLAELTGCGKSTLAADIQQRVLTYSEAEYQAMFDRLSPDAKDMVLGYVDGANAWREAAMLDPTLVPAEYALLSSTVAEFTVHDVLAAGVYITRFVAAEGGNEFLNIRMLKALQARFGPDEGLKAFQDMVWLEDDKATTTVPRAEGVFSNQPVPAAGRDAVLAAMAAASVNLPETLWKGAGTGHATQPADCDLTGIARAAKAAKSRSARVPELLAEVNDGLAALRTKPRGASFAFAIGRNRTRDGGTLLVSEPQLGYSYPLLLVEYEIHGAGYDARGVSVPILPTVGIGYTPNAAWALTTGYSKTIDSFIETICSTAQRAAGTCAANQYFHQGAWKNLDCRTETVPYRASVNGVPAGPALSSVDVEVCRTVHGPLVARDDAAGKARSVQYAMFGHEIETIEGIREWNRAKTFAEFVDGVRKVTWNENITVATLDGHIGYFHPGLFLARAANTDMRFPIPGEGQFDFGAPLPFDQLPHAADPAQGFLFNWNTKPAFGWLDGEGMGSTSRPGGPGQRGTNLRDTISARSDWTFDALRQIDIDAGTLDPRAREYLPLILAFRVSTVAALSAPQQAALDLVLGWDRRHYDLSIDIADEAARDSPGATIFHEYVKALRLELFGALGADVLDVPVSNSCGRPDTPQTIFTRVSGVGSHLFDQSVMDNLILRILDPASSSLPVLHDWSGGRSRDAVMTAALDRAFAALAAAPLSCDTTTAAGLGQCRRVHPRSYIASLTGVIGPGSDTVPGTSCVTMPYQDRGSWVHRVGFERP
ncbi:MAG TPA: penicillin acylase family protein [Solimonas sp.]|nr:penicillin acylase family protein [Solimonas sp.]